MQNKFRLKVIIGIVVCATWFKGCTSFANVPAYTIYLKDKVSGKPIAGALAEIKWKTEGQIAYQRNRFIEKELYLLSDEKGVLYVPRFKKLLMCAAFRDLDVNIYHPVYVTSGIPLYFEGQLIKDDKYSGYITRTGNENYSLSMISLEEKYENARCVTKNNQDECVNGGEHLYSDFSESRLYYFKLAENHIENINMSLVADFLTCKSIWEKLFVLVHPNSTGRIGIGGEIKDTFNYAEKMKK